MANVSKTREEIQTWIVNYLAEIKRIDRGKIDVTQNLERYGFDSSAMVVMTGDLEDWLGKSVEASVPYRFPTIEKISAYLAGEC